MRCQLDSSFSGKFNLFIDCPNFCNVITNAETVWQYMNCAFNCGFIPNDASFNIRFNHTYPGVWYLPHMFDRSYNFDGPVGNIFNAFPDLTDTRGMFGNCRNFNHLVTIPDTVQECAGMFANCFNLSSPVILGNNVVNCQWMFHNCHKYHYNINIPDSVRDCTNMFNNAFNYSSSDEWVWFTPYISLGNNIVNTLDMFNRCTAFRPSSPIIVPASVNDCRYMFRRCFYEYNRTGQYQQEHIYWQGAVTNIIFKGGSVDTNVQGTFGDGIKLQALDITVEDNISLNFTGFLDVSAFNCVNINFFGEIFTPNYGKIVSRITVDDTRNTNIRFLGNMYGELGIDPSHMFNTDGLNIYVKSLDDAFNAVRSLREAYDNGQIRERNGNFYNRYGNILDNGKRLLNWGWFSTSWGYGYSTANTSVYDAWNNPNNYSTSFNVIIQ